MKQSRLSISNRRDTPSLPLIKEQTKNYLTSTRKYPGHFDHSLTGIKPTGPQVISATLYKRPKNIRKIIVSSLSSFTGNVSIYVPPQCLINSSLSTSPPCLTIVASFNLSGNSPSVFLEYEFSRQVI